jgi:anti-sigma regulatory factor (Ser/Thr protein kinase)
MVKWSFDTRDARAAREARAEFAKHVERIYGTEADVMAAELVLGELIGNVVRYAPGPAHVTASFDSRGVTIDVADRGNGFSRPHVNCETRLLNESGRGLAIVERLARRLEIRCAKDDGCRVRARLDVARARATEAAGGRRES